MPRTSVIAFFLTLIAVAPVSAEMPNDAATLMRQFASVQIPRPDRSRAADPAYVRQFHAEYQAAMKQRTELARQFADRFPDHPSAPGMLLVVAQMSRENKAEQLAVYRRIVEKYPNSDAANAAAGPLRQADSIGKPFSLTFKDAMTGRSIDTANLKGKVLVIDFWATWCGPCVASMPENKALYAEWKNKGVEFIGVSLDQSESAGGLTRLKDFVAKNELPWPQYYQGNGWQSEFSRSRGISGIPCIFIVDQNGNLVTTEGRAQLKHRVPELLANGAPPQHKAIADVGK